MGSATVPLQRVRKRCINSLQSNAGEYLRGLNRNAYDVDLGGLTQLSLYLEEKTTVFYHNDILLLSYFLIRILPVISLLSLLAHSWHFHEEAVGGTLSASYQSYKCKCDWPFGLRVRLNRQMGFQNKEAILEGDFSYPASYRMAYCIQSDSNPPNKVLPLNLIREGQGNVWAFSESMPTFHWHDY